MKTEVLHKNDCYYKYSSGFLGHSEKSLITKVFCRFAGDSAMLTNYTRYWKNVTCKKCLNKRLEEFLFKTFLQKRDYKLTYEKYKRDHFAFVDSTGRVRVAKRSFKYKITG